MFGILQRVSTLCRSEATNEVKVDGTKKVKSVKLLRPISTRAYSSFYSIKGLGVLLDPPGWDATSPTSAGTQLLLGGESK